VAEELHQRVDADVGVGELGGEGVAQAMYYCAGGAFTVDGRFFEGPQDPVLQCSAGDPLSVGAEEQRALAGKAVSGSASCDRLRDWGKRARRDCR
jgi:hypothetical protein